MGNAHSVKRRLQGDMKIFAELLILAASLQLYYVSADSEVEASADSEADSSSSTAHIPCNCHLIYKPVCGTDGWTYSNECVLKCISDDNIKNGRPPIFVKSQGECPKIPCNCPKIYNPLCGTDNQTYGNDCLFDCENKRRKLIGLPPIRVAYRGVCRITCCNCPGIIIPVCGTDNRTYRNICFLQCQSRINQANGKPPIFVKHGGPCVNDSCLCTLEVDPLCASDGNTYDNPCILHCQNRRRAHLGLPPLTVQYKGECIDCICPAVYDPVCASNGVTYANSCTLGCENKRRALMGLPPLVITSRGVCPCICTLEYDPVCGTDQRTYGNRCHLRCENKRRQDLGMPLIYIAYPGPCICKCNYCPWHYQPVCGSDGRTYWNKCWLDCNRNCNGDVGRPLYMLHHGPC